MSWFWSEVILTISRSLEEKVKNSCSVYIFLIETLLFHTNIEYDLWSVECHNFYPIPFNQVIGHWKKMQNLFSVYYKCFLWIPRNFTHRSFITWKCVWFWPKVIWASSRSLERKGSYFCPVYRSLPFLWRNLDVPTSEKIACDLEVCHELDLGSVVQVQCYC